MPRDSYYREAATWDREIYQRLRRSRGLAWIVAGVSAGIAVLAMLAVVLVLPLKEFAPYVVTVDRSTGYVEVTRGLKPGDLTEDEAVTMANIVRHVTARETYDPADVQENFDHVIRTSSKSARKQHETLYDRDNPLNPVNRFGYDGRISVQIKNISLLNKRTAAVRFQTTTQARDGETVEHWVTILQFRYVNRPASLAERFQNPLGFDVTSYRRDQEIVGQ